MEPRVFGRPLFSGFGLPGFAFKESNFLPEPRPRSLFEALRSKRFVRRFAFGLVLVMGSTFAALQVNASGDPGHDSVVDFALTLNGSEQNASITSPVLPISDDFVLEAWIFDEKTHQEGTGRIISQGKAEGATTADTNPGGFDIMTRNSNVSGRRSLAVFYKCQTTCQLIETNVLIPNNSWQHIALVTSGSSFQLYVNGQLAFTSATLSTSPMSPSAFFFLGRPWRNDVTDSRFKGKIDEVNVWTKPGTITTTAGFETWIQGHMHNYTPANTEGLHARFDFNEGSGNTVFDRKGANNLTLEGSPIRVDVKQVSSASNGDTIVTFPRTYLPGVGNWTVPQNASNFRALVVAGGGGGGFAINDSGWRGGGGGAGGVTNSPLVGLPATVSVVVGQGGLGGIGGSQGIRRDPRSGQLSKLGSIETSGGGRGGSRDRDPDGGGSGGGGQMQSTDAIPGASGVPGQGNSGGAGLARAVSGESLFAAGGGGGAGGAGGSATGTLTTNATGGNGGAGITLDISGSSTKYAWGGAGAGLALDGFDWNTGARAAGLTPPANTGAGGGGGEHQTNNTGGAQFNADVVGGNGASGVVIVRYTPTKDLAWQGASALQRSSTTIPPRFYTNSTPVPTANNQAFTAEAWVYHDERSGNQAIFGGGLALNTVADRFYLGVDASGSMRARAGGRVLDPVSAATIPTGQWTHVAATVTATNTVVSFWINGTLVHTSPDLGPRNSIGSFFSVGDSNTEAEIWRGQIDQVKIWESVLNEAQIRESMHSYQKGAIGTGSIPNATLRAHYDFNEYIEGVEPNRAGTNTAYNLISGNSGSEYVDNRILETGTAHDLQTYVKFNRSYLTATGGWTPPLGATKFKALVVAGGGGGGGGHDSNHGGGGGGAGGLLQPVFNHSSGPLRIEVGAGGAGGSGRMQGRIGGDSKIGTSITAKGGGGGGAYYSNSPCVSTCGGGATTGGSGGGAGAGQVQTGANPIPGQGFAGGSSTANLSHGAGGGGAGGVGSNNSNSPGPGPGGIGIESRITGSPAHYAGGGGGGSANTNTAAGGLGGGGKGASYASSDLQPTAGTANTGGGGGGGRGFSGGQTGGGAGGSGVVVLSYGHLADVIQTPGGARAGSSFARSIKVQIQDPSGNPHNPATQQQVTLTVPNNVLRSFATGASSTPITTMTVTTIEGVATFEDIGFVSGVSGTQTLTFTSDALVGTTLEVAPTFIASSVNITSSGPTNGSFVNGVFQSSTSSTANIWNSDLVTAMGSGSVLVESSGPINVQASVSSPTAGSKLTLKANTNIQISANVTVQTNNADLVFWSDANASGQGSFGAMTPTVLNTANGSTSQLSGGGKVVIAGGADTDLDGVPDGFARGVTGVFGGSAVQLGDQRVANSITIDSGGGDVIVRGQSNRRMGIVGQGQLVVRSGVGQVSFTGNSDALNEASDNNNTHAIEFVAATSNASLIESQSPMNPAISFVGRATGTVSDSLGLSFLGGTPPESILISAKGSGGVYLAGRNTQTDAHPLRMNGVSVHSQTGPIVVEAEGSSATNDLATLDLREAKNRFGAFGELTSSADITIRADSFVGVSTSNKTEFNTSGTLTLESYTGGFSGGLTLGSGFDFKSGLGGLSVGKAGSLSGNNFTGGNSTDLTFSSAISIAGPISGYGSNIFVSENLTTTGVGSKVLLRTPGNINVGTHSESASNPGKQIQTNGGSIVLWSDSDSNGAGLVRLLNNAQLCTVSANCTTATSGGGDIVIGGGAADPNDSSRPGGFAIGYGDVYLNNGTSTTTGIQLGTLDQSGQGARLYSAGGNVVLRGGSTTDQTNKWRAGIGVVGGTIVNSGAGTILFEGTHRADHVYGSGGAIEFNAWSGGGGVSISSANTSATAVVVRAYQDGGTANHMGVWGGNESTTFNVSGGLLFDVDRISDNIGFVFNVSGPLEIKPYGTTLRNSGTASDFKFNSSKISFTSNPSKITIGSSTNTPDITVGTNLTTSSGDIQILTNGAISKTTTTTLTAAAELVINSRGSTVNTGTGAISAGTVRLSGSTGMTSSAPITSSGVVEISSTTGTNLVSGTTNAAGNLIITGATVSVTAAQTTTNSRDITVTASGNYSSTGSGTLNSDGAVNIESTGGTVSTLAITATSNVVLRSSSNATVGGATSAGGSVLVESGGTTALNNNITAGSQGILVKSVGRITTSAGTSASPRKLETSSGDITLWTNTTGTNGGVTFNNWLLIDSDKDSSGTGGDITIGGGEASSDTSRPAGNATSSSGSAIVLGASNSDDVVKITTGSGKGNISIKGEATSTSAHSGIFFRAGVKIIGETVSLYGKSRYSSETGFSAAGIYHYTGDSDATTLIEATASYQTHREALVIESEAMSSRHAMMLGNDANGRTFNTVTIRTSGNYADIRFTGISGLGGSGTGVWMAGAVMETYTGNVLMDSPSNRVVFSRSQSGRQVTYSPTEVGFGGDITIRSLGRDTRVRESLMYKRPVTSALSRQLVSLSTLHRFSLWPDLVFQSVA
jgi:hypothetical protein